MKIRKQSFCCRIIEITTSGIYFYLTNFLIPIIDLIYSNQNIGKNCFDRPIIEIEITNKNADVFKKYTKTKRKLLEVGTEK